MLGSKDFFFTVEQFEIDMKLKYTHKHIKLCTEMSLF